jgi:hypothetical protein
MSLGRKYSGPNRHWRTARNNRVVLATDADEFFTSFSAHFELSFNIKVLRMLPGMEPLIPTALPTFAIFIDARDNENDAWLNFKQFWQDDDFSSWADRIVWLTSSSNKPFIDEMKSTGITSLGIDEFQNDESLLFAISGAFCEYPGGWSSIDNDGHS